MKSRGSLFPIFSVLLILEARNALKHPIEPVLLKDIICHQQLYLCLLINANMLSKNYKIQVNNVNIC